MRIEIINAILKEPKKPMNREYELTTEERFAFREVMTKAGMGASVLYQRMQYIGFDEWELMGIERCVDTFAVIKRQVDASLVKPDSLSDVWQWLVEHGLHTEFTKYMGLMGMSRNTVAKRFTSMDFKPWELMGIEYLLHQSDKVEFEDHLVPSSYQP